MYWTISLKAHDESTLKDLFIIIRNQFLYVELNMLSGLAPYRHMF